ncbi:4-(cytidine 5'-diphospho)-2-C-methyl-D-erythritol kinase [Brevibacterium daeguense]|uniref:4-diphosphocytidyl-2-C-methyl-D-erythritol kinase n=1 Tax=Brevibacterium daeguense TaxID=909936 RepID=A0ABP8EFW4_9MICO|nr:4-(cytidine 5'-diphospho)-2-C-methyl-D-erythritol kinase [Brevibacterium daeguense]
MTGSRNPATGYSSVTARAYGKINVFLAVGPQMDDGYHELVTVFQSLDLSETVTLTVADSHAVSLTGRYADTTVPLDESNLALAAVLALAEATGTSVPVTVAIEKNVPVAGGMGGGSADAAAALLAYAHLIGCTDRELIGRVASSLGADVPFALRGGTALGTGRGDELNPVIHRGRFHWVLATSTGRLSTPEVYRRLDELRADAPSGPGAAEETADPAEVLRAISSGDPEALAGALHNDMTAAAVDLLPGLDHVMETGMRAGALAALVSGSGPTIGFLARDHTHALEIAVLLEASRGVRQVVRTTGPAGGARVVGMTSAEAPVSLRSED